MTTTFQFSEFDLTTGSVGPPLRCCEIMLREWTEGGYSPNGEIPQGELMIHGANVALGYYKDEEKTRESFIELNGKRWFATGDIGQIEPNGNIKIIGELQGIFHPYLSNFFSLSDRKKDLVKLSHGEYVSFGHVETVLRMHDLIDNICVYGNFEHSYLVALVVPNKKNLEEFAKKVCYFWRDARGLTLIFFRSESSSPSRRCASTRRCARRCQKRCAHSPRVSLDRVKERSNHKIPFQTSWRAARSLSESSSAAHRGSRTRLPDRDCSPRRRS